MAYNLLKGKRGIITGALDANSIAWKVAEKAYEEGATFVLTNAPIAMRMGEINKLAEKTKSEIIPADATNVDELTNLFTKSQELLGGKIDFGQLFAGYVGLLLEGGVFEGRDGFGRIVQKNLAARQGFLQGSD